MNENVLTWEYWDQNHGMNVPQQDADAITAGLKAKKGYKKARVILMNE